MLEEVVLATNERRPGSLGSQPMCLGFQTARVYVFIAVFTLLLRLICLIHLRHVISPQAMLMRQQDRLEGRVQNIDEQLTKLESDKTLMKVQDHVHRPH